MGNRFFKTTIVSAFPGLGQDVLADKSQNGARYIQDPFDPNMFSKKAREDVLYGFINQIAPLSKSKHHCIVFVSHREDLRRMMVENNIPYTIMMPDNTENMKKFLEDSCKTKRYHIDWDSDIESMKLDPHCAQRVVIPYEQRFNWTKNALMY